MSGTVGSVNVGAADVEELVLCDVQGDGSAVRFIRRYTTTADGTTTFVDVDYANAPYVPTGTVGACPEVGEETDVLQQVLCDVQPAGTVVQFLRSWPVDNTTGTVGAAIDTTLDGVTAYAPTGTAQVCEPDVADREGICYTLTSTGDTVHSGWARHQDSLPNTPQTPNGIAFFTALGVPIDPTVDGFAVVPCSGGCDLQVVERCNCDDVNGDGTVINQYVELWSVDPCDAATAPVLLGTFLEGDFSQPYTPVNPVACPADGPAEVTPTPILTGARNITGTAPQDLVAAHPNLQSVTLTVLAGSVNASLSDGTNVPFPAGTSHTWSVVKDDHDSALSVASFAGADAASQFLLAYTFK